MVSFARATQALIDRAYNSSFFGVHVVGAWVFHLRRQWQLGWRSIKKVQSFKVVVNNRLPPLAWLCRIDPQQCVVTAGPSVEVFPDRVVEGVWTGQFDKGEFHKSPYLFGSGVVFCNGRLIFAPPKHALEALFVLNDKINHCTFVSSSLAFAIAAAGISVDEPFFSQIAADLNPKANAATALGADKYVPLICENEQFKLRIMLCDNFMADVDANIRVLPQRPSAPFRTYAQYKHYIVAQIKCLFENAASSRRMRPLSPLTSASRGYDSPAVSALAKECGWERAVTLDVNVIGLDDGGSDIAECLGLNVKSFNHIIADVISNLRFDFDGPLKDKALEFVATMGVGDDVTFQSFEPELKETVFLTGAFGDSIWDRNSNVPPGLPIRVIFGKSLTEFRLRVGFAHVPVPMIGARFPARIKAISCSEEMQPYSVGTDYDRPIPRRIAEEAGVPRSAFGKAKNATSPLPTNFSALFSEAMTLVMKRYS